MTRITIVNDQDEIIGFKERSTVDKSDIYRVAALWITNSNGDILLVQRAFTTHHDPGKWAAAVAGTVDEGETYEANIIKEAEEEIGLRAITPTKGPKVRVSGEYEFFCQWYTLCIDHVLKAFSTAKDEVAQIKWFTRTELEADLRRHPEHYVADFADTLNLLAPSVA